MPTAFCLNSLFVPCYRQPRLIQSIDLVHLWKSRKGIYRGARLDLADADLFMALLAMHHQKGVPLGAVFCAPTYAILSACKPLRKTFGSSDYLWGSKALKRLYDARMILAREKAPDVVEKIGSESLPLRLVKEFSISSSSVTLQFDPRLATLFENSQFTLIDIECHVKLRSDLSKALHLVFASMRERVQRHRLSRLLLRLDYIIPTGKAKRKLMRLAGIWKWLQFLKHTTGKSCLMKSYSSSSDLTTATPGTSDLTSSFLHKQSLFIGSSWDNSLHDMG